MEQYQLSQDERLMAALAHGSIMIGMMGIVVSVIIWVTQKEKSVYAARQAMQAAVYQLVGMMVYFGVIIFGSIAMFSAIRIMENPVRFMLCFFAPLVVWGLYGLWGAYKCWQGDDFRYPLIGNLLVKE